MNNLDYLLEIFGAIQYSGIYWVKGLRVELLNDCCTYLRGWQRKLVWIEYKPLKWLGKLVLTVDNIQN